MKNSIDIRQRAWFGDDRVTIDFPEEWDVQIFSPPEMEALHESEIRRKIESPIGFDSLDMLVLPGKKVLIICDDISRPTRTDLILPVLLGILEERGIAEEQISILVSSGTHDLMDEGEIALKLGKEIADKYNVFLHHCKRGNVYIGRTSRGTPVYVNRHLERHDLVIGVGGIVPHNPAGFGGGAKLILGVCGIRTILHFHQRRKGIGTGGDIENEFRLDVLEAARMAGLEFIVNTLVNRDREVTEIFSGDVDQAFRTGVDMARKYYGVPNPDSGNFDLVIADVYPFDASFAFTRKGWWPVMNVSQECHKMIISAMPKGVGGHLVFPIPNDRKINKLVRLYFELITFGIRHFMTKSLASRIRTMLRKMGFQKGKRLIHSKTPGADKVKSSRSEVPGGDVVYFHGAKREAANALQRLPYRLFSSPGEYLKYITEVTGNRPLRVAFYRSSSLTFPEYR
ncbi:MAG: DUF2088 domain-containing protein [Bacteroidales bacterium]|nr:DUF2088 domain-containing protein [Bacteroidales bacterium]